MSFRECINCEYVSCTLFHRCLLIAESIVKNTPEQTLQIEAVAIAAIHQKMNQKRARNKNFHAPVPLAGYARRRRKNGHYGDRYNYLHTGNWHGVIRFMKNN